jgi:phosphodiesterase/alkaline phosphatase D-like protein
VEDLTSGSATLRGTVNARGLTTTYHFEYGPTATYGTETAAATVSGSDDQNAVVAMVGLTPDADYHYRLVAENSQGATKGRDRTFHTAPAS